MQLKLQANTAYGFIRHLKLQNGNDNVECWIQINSLVYDCVYVLGELGNDKNAICTLRTTGNYAKK